MRRVASLIIAFILVFAFSLSVSAADLGTSGFKAYYVVDGDLPFYLANQSLPEGIYDIQIFVGSDLFYTIPSVPVTYDEYFMDSPCSVFAADLVYEGVSFPVSILVGYGDSDFTGVSSVSTVVAFCVVSDDGRMEFVAFDDDSSLTFSPSAPNSILMDSVSDNLSRVLSWVGHVLDSFMDGPLLPLFGMMALPIAISALFVGIKALKRNSWGT